VRPKGPEPMTKEQWMRASVALVAAAAAAMRRADETPAPPPIGAQP
jgi:hypothetical protein